VFAAQAPLEIEHTAVAALLDALEGTGATLLFTSGTGVLGQRTWGAPGGEIHAEDDPVDPEPLAVRRVDTERLVRGAASRGVRGIVLRPPVLWGPGDHGHLSQIYRSVAVTGAACYVGAGLNSYSTLYIDDPFGSTSQPSTEVGPAPSTTASAER
jgi:nucleoside-diphosphate-sugar epimerase